MGKRVKGETEDYAKSVHTLEFFFFAVSPFHPFHFSRLPISPFILLISMADASTLESECQRGRPILAKAEISTTVRIRRAGCACRMFVAGQARPTLQKEGNL